MADAEEREGGERVEDRESWATSPFVQQHRPDPSKPPQPVLILEGLAGDSDLGGFRRLYFTRSLKYYADFRADDIVDIERIPGDQSPLHGLEATRVAIKEGATVEYTHYKYGRSH